MYLFYLNKLTIGKKGRTMKGLINKHFIRGYGFLLIVLMIGSCSDLALNTDNEENESATSPTTSLEQSDVAQDTLFTVVNNLQLSTQQEKSLLSIENRLSTTQVHLGRLAKNVQRMLQNGQPIELNIVPDKSMVMGKKETEQLDDGGLYWEGTLQNRIGEVRLVADNEGVVGYLKAPSDSLFYKFQPIGGEGNLHALIEVHDPQLVD